MYRAGSHPLRGGSGMPLRADVCAGMAGTHFERGGIMATRAYLVRDSSKSTYVSAASRWLHDGVFHRHVADETAAV